jgi:hypothetical protein
MGYLVIYYADSNEAYGLYRIDEIIHYTKKSNTKMYLKLRNSEAEITISKHKILYSDQTTEMCMLFYTALKEIIPDLELEKV